MTHPSKAPRGHGWLPRNQRGSVAIQVGIMMIAILGFVALGVEITFLLLKHREMQSAADGAAMSGATALSYGAPSDFRMEARAVASASGFTNGVDETTVTVNSPPLSGSNAGNEYAVEVIISQPQHLSLVRLFRAGLFDVGARAVALAQPGYQYCILSLDPTASGAVYVWNNAVVSNASCGVAVNSSSSSALTLRNNAAINGPTHVHGGASLSNNADLKGSPNVENGPVISDPYADVELETIPACTAQSGTAGNNVTVYLDPGHFCSGWNFENNVTVHLAAGAYYIDTQLSLGNNLLMTGTGVTLIINGDYSVTFSNNARIQLTAPTTGTYAGIAIFGKRDGSANVHQTFSNNTSMDIQGVIYFPNQIIDFENNGTTGAAQCTQVIGRIINIRNNVELDNNCAGTGVKPIGGGLSNLVE